MKIWFAFVLTLGLAWLGFIVWAIYTLVEWGVSK